MLRIKLLAYHVASLLLLLSFLPLVAQSQTSPSETTTIVNPPPTEPPTRHISRYDRIFSDSDLQLTFAVLAFGFLVLCLQFIMMWRANLGSEVMLKMSTITLVIFSLLFLITAGFGSEQIAPAMGLLGTIVGYVLGRETKQG